jgi:hypothetical protein
VKGTSFDISVEPDKLRAVKIYVTTGDAGVTGSERSDFHFNVEELNPKEGRATESVSYRAIFHAPAKKD